MFSLIRVFPLCSDSGGFRSHRWLGDYQNHNSTSAQWGWGCLYLPFSSYNSSSVAVVVPDFRQRKCLISSSYFLPLPLALLIFSFFISWRQLCLTWLFFGGGLHSLNAIFCFFSFPFSCFLPLFIYCFLPCCVNSLAAALAHHFSHVPCAALTTSNHRSN